MEPLTTAANLRDIHEARRGRGQPEEWLAGIIEALEAKARAMEQCDLDGEARMANDVFISYNSADRPWAEKLNAELTRRGQTVFLDVTNIRVGSDWKDALIGHLAESRNLVLLWSDTNAANSRWVSMEAAAFRTLMVVAEKKGTDLNRQMIQICLEGHNPDLTGWQAIEDLNDGRQFAAGAGGVDPNLWTTVVDKIVEAVDYDPKLRPVNLLVVAATRERLEKVPDNRAPIHRAKSLGDLLADLKVAKADLLAQYGEVRSEWRPFGGTENVRTLLSKFRVDIIRNGGPKFRWKPVKDSFWTADPGSVEVDEIERQLREDPSVIVIDAISLYEPQVFARYSVLLDALYNPYGSLIVLPPFPAGRRESLRLALLQIARELHNRFWTPQFVDSRMVQASCAVTAPDSLEMRRLLAAALHAGQKSKHWSVVP